MALRKEQEKLYTVDEFLELPDVPEYAELIDGVIYDMAPPDLRHQRISGNVFFAIKSYIVKNKGKCELFSAPTGVKLGKKKLVEPDVFVVCDPDKLKEKYCSGAPDWVIEIVSPSNSAHDYIDKLKLYSEHGVKEYWIVDPNGERVIVYIFEQPNLIGFYTFDDDIPVWIYRDEPEQLSICINSLLS